MAQAPRAAGDCLLEKLGDGRYALVGELGLRSAATVLAAGLSAFAGEARVEVDLSRVERTDSAGLAVLIEWTRAARHAGTGIAFRALPARLSALARIGGVDQILPVAG